MEDFVTLDRSHPQFKSFLLGKNNEDRIPIPVKSFNINRNDESVTFQLLTSKEINKPHLIKILARVFRLDLLPLTFMPALAVAIQLHEEIKNPSLIIYSLLSLLFIHAAVFCRNDFVDHMRGIDRLNEKSGSRVIQSGWLRAATVQNIYRLLITVSLVFAIPVFWLHPELLLMAAVVAVMGVIGYSHLRWAAIHWLFGDLSIFLCLGIFITWGMSQVAVGYFPFQSLLLGCFYGLIAVLYVEIRHMISIVIDYEAKLMTLPVRVGFDRAKLIAIAILIMSLFVLVFYVTVKIPGIMSLLGFPLVVGFVWFGKKIFSIQSPLSSTLYELPREIMSLYIWVTVFLLALFAL